MYKPYRASLKAIWRELRRASQQYPPLFHQRFSDPMLVGPDVISEAAFLAFQKAYPQRSADDWASWERTPDGSYWGRFHGSEEGLDEFERLAESAYLTLREFHEYLPEDHGVHGWLNWIHETARDYPTPLLRTRYGVWGVDPQPDPEKFDEVVTRWAKSEEMGCEYRPHPFFNLLVHNVFTSSLTAIERILNPSTALLIGDALDDTPAWLAQHFPSEDSGIGDASGSKDDGGHETPEAFEETGSTKSLVTRPIIDMTFDGATWHCRFEFLNVKEEGPFTTQMKGFDLFRTALHRDGRKFPSSVKFWQEAGLPHPEISFTSSGVVEADSEDRTVQLNADEDDAPVRLRSATQEDIIDPPGKKSIGKKLKDLRSELEESVNPARQAEIRQQIDQYESHWAKVLNRTGKSRSMAGSDEEKARKRINNRLKDARDMISKSMPRFAHFLKNTVVYRNGWKYDSRLALGADSPKRADS